MSPLLETQRGLPQPSKNKALKDSLITSIGIQIRSIIGPTAEDFYLRPNGYRVVHGAETVVEVKVENNDLGKTTWSVTASVGKSPKARITRYTSDTDDQSHILPPTITEELFLQNGMSVVISTGRNGTGFSIKPQSDHPEISLIEAVRTMGAQGVKNYIGVGQT